MVWLKDKYDILEVDDLSIFNSLEIKENRSYILKFEPKNDVFEPISLKIIQNQNSAFKLICIFKTSLEFNLSLDIIGKCTTTEIYNLIDLTSDKNVTLNEIFFTSQRDNQVDHITKCVLDKSSSASIKHVAKVGQSTKNLSVNQKIQSLILSPKAKVQMQPILQIESENVQCKHSSTQGFLDTKAIFYLQSRGMNKKASKNLLVEVFKGEIINLINS